MPILRLEDATLSFGQVPLLDKIDLQIDSNEKIFLIGRNGMGKSCLLNIIMGHMKLDGGKIHLEPSTKVAELAQDLPTWIKAT